MSRAGTPSGRATVASRTTFEALPVDSGEESEEEQEEQVVGQPTPPPERSVCRLMCTIGIHTASTVNLRNLQSPLSRKLQKLHAPRRGSNKKKERLGHRRKNYYLQSRRFSLQLLMSRSRYCKSRTQSSQLLLSRMSSPKKFPAKHHWNPKWNRLRPKEPATSINSVISSRVRNHHILHQWRHQVVTRQIPWMTRTSVQIRMRIP